MVRKFHMAVPCVCRYVIMNRYSLDMTRTLVGKPVTAQLGKEIIKKKLMHFMEPEG
jgi:hypothetical protein